VADTPGAGSSTARAVTPTATPAKAPAKRATKAARKAVAGTPAASTQALPVRDGDEPWTEAEVAEVRAALARERAELSSELNAASAAYDQNVLDGDAGTGDDQGDAGSAALEREQELSLAANSRDLLSQVEHAEERLAAQTYGWCEDCGEPIGKARLMAFPKVTLCVACKQRETRR
jgi:DnaK suppressor protein